LRRRADEFLAGEFAVAVLVEVPEALLAGGAEVVSGARRGVAGAVRSAALMQAGSDSFGRVACQSSASRVSRATRSG